MNTPRHRGGQLGNANALKHGFYTRRFKEKDISGVEQINVKDLAEEVALIRILARRLVEASSPSADLYELDDQGTMTVNWEGCLECGTCLICCDHRALTWTYPSGPFGVQYRMS